MVNTHRGPNPPTAPLSAEAEGLKSTANDLFKAGKWDEAHLNYSRAIELAPDSFTLYSNRALTSLKLGPAFVAGALADAQKAVQLAPQFGKGWVRVGEALAASGRDKEAVEAFEKAVKFSEGNIEKGECRRRLARSSALVEPLTDPSPHRSQKRSRSWRRPRPRWAGTE